MLIARTNTPVMAIDTKTTSLLFNSMVAPQPAVSLDLKSFGMALIQSSGK
jgi:hypothetical protein